MTIDAEIASSTVDLMALSAKQLIRLERELRRSQRKWLRQMRRTCRSGSETSIGIARCRLREMAARRDLVRAVLNKMRLQFGQAPLMPTPDEFEVLVPLPDPPAGPDVDTRLPLRIPLNGD